jgi:hypothetical protein
MSIGSYIIHTLILMLHRPDASLAWYTHMEAPTLADAGRPGLLEDRTTSESHNTITKTKPTTRQGQGYIGTSWHTACPHIYAINNTETPAKFVTQGLNPSVLNPIVRRSQSA